MERVIVYYSKIFFFLERNYCVIRRELLVTVKVVKYFRSYLYGRKFRLRIDYVFFRWFCRRREFFN